MKIKGVYIFCIGAWVAIPIMHTINHGILAGISMVIASIAIIYSMIKVESLENDLKK